MMFFMISLMITIFNATGMTSNCSQKQLPGSCSAMAKPLILTLSAKTNNDCSVNLTQEVLKGIVLERKNNYRGSIAIVHSVSINDLVCRVYKALRYSLQSSGQPSLTLQEVQHAVDLELIPGTSVYFQ